MKKYFIIFAIICFGIFGGCGKEEINNSDTSKIDEVLENKEISLSKVDEGNDQDTNSIADEQVDNAEKNSLITDEIDSEKEKENKREIITKDPVPYEESYKIALCTLLSEGMLPGNCDVYADMIKTGMERSSIVSEYGEMSENEFAIADVDEDGKIELIVAIRTAPDVFRYISVYEVNPDTNEYLLEVKLQGDNAQFFTNGLIKQPWTHNDELGGDELWPYQLLDYIPDSDIYEYTGRVDSWSKAMHPEDYENIKFPDDVDVDKVGVVYDLNYSDGYSGGYVYSQSDFIKFENKLFGNREEIKLDYKKLTSENIG